MKTKKVMIQGTASSVGKSLITTALLHILTCQGYSCAPFKSQNVALNSYVTADGLEMGRSQAVQAQAAGIEPNVNMNPILLKPVKGKGCQVILLGKPQETLAAEAYASFKPELRKIIRNSFEELAKNYEIILIEGAGSPVEMNLLKDDIVNMGIAELVDSPVILVTDIERGGMFASVVGTLALMPEAQRQRVKGVIINKFIGDVKLFEEGTKILEDLIKIPVLGVIPYGDFNIEDEDTLTDKFSKQNSKGEISVNVIHLPHISNFTDFDILMSQEDVSFKYVRKVKEMGNPDIIILPGTKNTIGDLRHLKASGLFDEIVRLHRKGAMVVGICGGFQMLGKMLVDVHGVEENAAAEPGFGFFDIETVFEREKTTVQVEAELSDGIELLGKFTKKRVNGYEIHMGQTRYGNGSIPFATIVEGKGRTGTVDGCIAPDGSAFGTYLHGIFDNAGFLRDFINTVRTKKGLEPLVGSGFDEGHSKFKEYAKLGDHVKKHLDMDIFYKILDGEL